VEMKDTNLGNVMTEKEEEEKHILRKRRSMWKKKQNKLMMRKCLLKQEKELDEQIQQTSLFRTSCNSKDRVCKVIIDSGSIDNIVSIEMVGKLELNTTAPPKPYKVSWLYKGNQFMVSEQC
jgi:hypothetical protein